MDTVTALETLVEKIKADYKKYVTNNGQDIINTDMEERLNKFNDSIQIHHGTKYIKIVKASSVWGFVVAVDNDKKFQKGDILKGAGFSTPARNQARGNIFNDDYSISWSNPHYL